jgi:hypothetical protein
MSTLLHIASRVEAAVEAYVSVRYISNMDEWSAGFEREMVSAHLCGVSITPVFDMT